MTASRLARYGVVEAAVWALNGAAAFLVTRYLFEMNSKGVLGLGWDQQGLQSFLSVWRTFSTVLFGLSADPVNGLGNIAWPMNPGWSPSYLLTSGPTGSFAHGPLTFAVAATELFLATALCGRMLRLPLAVSFGAAWLLTLATWPIFVPPKIITLWLYTPQHAEILAVASVLAALALRIDEGSVHRAIAIAVAIFAGLTYLLLALPSFVILALPVLGVFAASTLVTASSRKWLFTIVGCWAGIAAASLMCGYFHYLAGLFGNTAAAQFPDLAKRLPTLYGGETTLLLWTPLSSFSSVIHDPERAFVVGGLLGSLAMIGLGSSYQRRAGIGVVATEVTLVATGLANYWLNFWSGPAIWYFECFLFPFLALGCCYLVAAPLIALWRAWLLWGPPLPTFHGERIWRNAGIVLVLALPVAAIVYARKIGPTVRIQSQQYIGYRFASLYPQPESAITKLLKSEIRLVPGKPFRGRVATMLGRVFPEERYWGRYSLVHYFAQYATGNLHDGPGLWQDQIPTLFEYNPLMTPSYLAFVRTFFTGPEEIVFRNLVGTRRFDARMLKMFGVRFVLTDLPLDGPELRAKVHVPTPLEARKLLDFGGKIFDIDGMDLYLYELEGVNLGQFSPVEARLAKDANHVLGLLSDPALRPDHAVVLTETIADKLTRASLESFAIMQDGYRVQATSEGKALLLLPVEFSRCLTVVNRTTSPEPRLLRANLLLTGILFDRRLDVDISFRAGPFGAARCRLLDMEEGKHIGIRDAFRDRPAFGKLGWQDYWTK